MPERRIWTDAADETIRRMRVDGATWAAIAAVLGLSRNTIIERGRRLCAAGGGSAPPAGRARRRGRSRRRRTIRTARRCRPGIRAPGGC